MFAKPMQKIDYPMRPLHFGLPSKQEGNGMPRKTYGCHLLPSRTKAIKEEDIQADFLSFYATPAGKS